MSIQIPERKIAPPRQGIRIRPSSSAAPSQRVGYELERLGHTIQSLGKDWGDFAIKLAKMNATNEAFSAENEYNQGYEKFYSEDLSKDNDFEGRPERFVKWHEETTRDIMSRVKSPSAQRMLKNSFAKYRNTRHAQIYLQSQEFLRQETKVNFDIWETEKERQWASATPEVRSDIDCEYEGKLKELEDDGMLAPGEYEKRLNDFKENSQKRAYQEAVRGVRVRLKEMLAVSGEDETLKAILDEKNFPELEAMEYEKGMAAEARQDLALDVRQRARLFEKEYFRQKTDKLKVVIDEVIDKVGKDEPVEKAEVDELATPEPKEVFMSDKQKEMMRNADLRYIEDKTKEIREAPSKKGYKPETKIVTDWAVRTDLEDEILKYLLDVPKMDEAAANIAESKMKIKTAWHYKSEQKITKGDYDYLIKLMELDWKDKRDDYILLLQQGWDNIRETGFKGWPWGKAKSEEKAIINSRRALLHWMQAEIARKKELTLEGVISKSKQLLIASKKGYPRVPGMESYKMLEVPKDEDEKEIHYMIGGIWWQLSPDVQFQIWTDIVENKMTWKEVWEKEYE